MKIHILFILSLTLVLSNCAKDEPITDEPDPSIFNPPNGSEIYFPPIGSDVWETKSISSLGWNEAELQPLLNFLETKNTKSFMVLHKGKIIVESYLNNHNSANLWYWASAGKTLTSTICGIAQQEDLIDINDRVSDYIGTGWTSATLEKENLITCKHLLSMNSGLDDSIGDNVSPANLQYTADAGTRWAYHNVYVKLQDVIAETSNQTWSSYFNEKLRDKIGMNGLWLDTNDFSVYSSNTRSMARFGLLIYANGMWEDTEIVNSSFLIDATNTSQDINKSYGYLWWLNGKNSHLLPGLQFEFQNELVPNAPADLIAGLGKNDQKIYIVPSEDLVVIRMGNSAENTNLALSNFDNDLWGKINALIY